MTTQETFNVRGGLPWNRAVRVTDGKLIWADLADFEVRMQIRVAKDWSSALKYDFTPHLLASYDEPDNPNDILIRWNLTGAETKLLKGGFFDLIISDAGAIDSRAIPLVEGTISVDPIVTDLDGPS